MSLISDALKKARQEAARQDSLRQTLPYAVGTADTPERRNVYMPLLAGLGAGCILAALIFGVVYLGGWGPFSRTRKDAIQIAETPAPAVTTRTAASAEPAPVPPVIEERSQSVPPTPAPPPAPERIQEPKPTPAPLPAAPARVETPAPRTEPAPLTAEETRLAPPPVPTPAPAPVTPVVTTAVPPSAPSSGGLEDGKSYLNEVPVPGGGVVKLNGIAYSPDHPIAVIDGRVVAPGEVVQGFTVVEIQARQVKLQGHGATVFVTTK